MTGLDFKDLCAQLARSPHDPDLLYTCCAAAGEAFESEMLALIEERLRTLPADAAIRLHDRHMLVRYQDKRRRIAAGLSITNADSLADLDVRFAKDEVIALIREATAILQRDPQSFPAAVLLADAYTALGAAREAEKVFAQLRRASGEHPSCVANLDPAFHAAIPGKVHDAAMRLPPVLVTRDVPIGIEGVVLTCADYFYFQKFGWGLVDSFVAHNGPGVCLALHIFDMMPEERAEVVRRLAAYPNLTWSLSGEWTGLRGGESSKARGYYHAVRFIRYWQLLLNAPASVWMVDADTIFKADVAFMFEALKGYDVALYLLPGRLDVRNKVVASCIGAANTPAARDYLRGVAGYIAHYHAEGRLSWGIDQIALYAVTLMYDQALRIVGVPEKIINGSRGPDQIIWIAK
ncbi:MAG: hypothetical protein IT566_05325 [Rhodospirillaceae bacterium]|nr:hypothetical protein [Rhodospirillaceae bacterium]